MSVINVDFRMRGKKANKPQARRPLQVAVKRPPESETLAQLETALAFLMSMTGIKRDDLFKAALGDQVISFTLLPIENPNQYLVDVQAISDSISLKLDQVPFCGQDMMKQGFGVECMGWRLGEGRYIVLSCMPMLEIHLCQL